MDTSQLKNLASQALQNAFGSVPDPSRRFGQSIPTPEYLPGTAGMFVQPYELEEVTPEGERIDYSVMLENLKRSIPVDIASTPGYVADIYNLPSSVGEYLNLRFRGRPEEAAAVEFFPRGSQSSELAEQAVTEFYGSPAPEFPNIQTEVATRGAQIFADPFAAVGGAKYLGALGRGIRDVFTPTSPEELAAMQRLGITAGESRPAGAVQEMAEVARPANIPEGQALQFLHNTSAEKLLRQERMGGMPMPSVGVTREDVPFEGFGDITLVGRKEAFDPRTTRTNEIFSADAYTVRAPRPIRLANKDAYSRLRKEFGDVADRLGDSIMSEQYELEALSRKGSSTESAYDNVVRFFEYDYVPRIKFLEEKGVEIPLNKDGKIDRFAADDIVNQDFREEFFEWANKKKDEYLTGQELFITNPDRDYVLQKPRFAEYTADNVTKYMKKRSGRGQEGGMGSTGVGAQRAATTEQLSSMKAMQERRGEFVPRDEVERLREQQEQNFFDLTDELRKFYKYDANSFSYLDEVSEMITLSERKGLSSALKEVGFKDVSPEVVDKINQYKDSLRSSPVQYFEAKPKRTVQLEEFAGAIVPEKTPQSVIDMLEAKGIKIEKYKDEAERLKLRSKFPNTMFSAAPIGVGVGAQYQGMEQEAQPVRPEQFIKIPGQI